MKTIKILSLILLFVLSAFSTKAQNTLTIVDQTAAAGDIITVELAMDNVDPAVAFQLDIPLPAGFTFQTGTEVLSGRAVDHSITSSIINTNTLRLLSYSNNNNAFTGNSGVIVSFGLQTSSTAGSYVLNIENATVSNNVGADILTGVVAGNIELTGTHTITASAGVNGSISPTGSVVVDHGNNQTFNINPDAGYVVDDVLIDGVSAGPLSQYTFSNVTADHTISASFIASAMGPNTMILHDVNAVAGSIIDVFLEVENVDPFVAIQLDITLPAGFTYENGTVALQGRETDHTISASMIDASTLRLLTYSNTNAAFTGNTGNVASFQLQTPAIEGTYNLNQSNIFLTNVGGDDILTAVTNSVITLSLVQYDLTMAVNGSGSTSPAVGIHTYAEGANVAIEAFPDVANVFDRWVINGVDDFNNPTSVVMNANTTATAYFVAASQYTVTLQSNPAGISTLTGDGTYYEAENVIIETSIPVGYTFDGWTGYQATTDNPYSFIMPSQNVSFTANFSANTYTISASAAAGGTITPSGNVVVNHGDNQIFDITPDAGYIVDDVLVDGVSVGPINQYTFNNVTANHTIEASFIVSAVGPNVMIVHDVNAIAGDIIDVYVEIENNDPVVAFQFDIPLPTGFTYQAGSAVLTGRETNHVINDGIVGTNTLRILSYSNTNDEFTGNNGNVCTFQLQTPAETGTHNLNLVDAIITHISGEDILTGITNGVVNLTAQFDLTLAVNGNGTTNPAVGVHTYDDGTIVNIEATPDVGNDFVRWEVNGVDDFNNPTSVTMTENIAATAFFEVTTYTITATAGVGGTITPDGAVVVNYGNNQIFDIAPDLGYEIADVLVDGVSQGAIPQYTFNNVTANHTIEAQFTMLTYNLTYTAGPGGSISGVANQTVNYGDDGTAVEAVPDAGYHFVQWSDGVLDNPRTDLNVTADITAEAQFAINTYTLTYTAGPNGSLTGSTLQTVNHGSNGTAVEAVPNATYHFVQWSDGVLDNPRTDLNVTGDITVEAQFAINTYTLTYIAGPNGSLTGNTSQTVNHGADGTAVSANPNVGYEFVDWSDGSIQNPRTDVNVTADITVTANFAIYAYVITATSGLNGTVSPAGDTAVEHGQSQEYTITPDPGYRIESVLIDGVSAGTPSTYTFENVQANHTIHATFVLRNYTIGVSANPVDGGTVTGGGSYNHFEMATVSATPEVNYSFVDWTESGATVSTDANYTFEVTGNRTLVANFALDNQYNVSLASNPVVGGSVSGGGSYFENDPVAISATPAVGYNFIEWTGSVDDLALLTDPASTDNTFNMPARAVALSANFDLMTYTITASAGVGGSISPVGDVVVNHGDNQTFDITPDAGYSILRVRVNGVSQGAIDTYTFTNVTANHTITAEFELETYTITASAGAGGTINPAGDVVVNHGGDQIFDIAADIGYEIDDVLVDAISQGAIPQYTFTNVTANHTIEAQFAILTFNLTYTAGIGGTISGNANQTVDYGQNGTTVEAIPDAGYHFVQWSDGVLDNPRTDMNVISDITVEAEFALNTYALTYTAGVNGSITGDAVQLVQHGSDGTAVEAVPDAGYHFVQWSDGSVQNPRTDLNVTGDITVEAEFAINTYTITASSGANGTVDPDGVTVVEYNGSQIYTITPAAGYSVEDVLVDGTSVGTPSSYTFENVQSDHTIHATFVINTYTIDVAANPVDGGNVTGGGSYNHFEMATVSATPEVNYSFVEWTEGGATVSTDANYTFEVTGNRTLVANFALDDTYNVSLSRIPAEGGTVSGGGNYFESDLVSISATPAAGYNFVEWTGSVDDLSLLTDPASTDNSFNMPARAVALTANFELMSYTIAASAGMGGSIDPVGNIVVNHGANQTFDVYPDAGYEINDVLVDGISAGAVPQYTFTNVTANHTIEAQFAILTFNLTYTPGTGGTISGDANQTVDYGQNGTAVEAIPDAGYHFVQWSDGVIDNPRTDINVTADITVEAEFALNTYTLTYTAGANGSISGNAVQTVEHGSDGTAVEAMPDAGYHFVQWDDGVTDNPRTDINVTGDINAEAIFAINTYTLTYTAGANGSILGDTPQAVDHGSDGTPVEAVPGEGYHFVQWSDGILDNPRTDINVTSDITVEAEFAINEYLISVVANPVDGGSVIGGGLYQHGDMVTVTATANASYEFVHWTVSGSIVSTEAVYAFTATSDINLVAVFVEENQYVVTLNRDPVEGGSVTGSGAYLEGDLVTINATAASGYEFVEWTGYESSTANMHQFTMPAQNVELTAHFSVNTYIITATAGVNGIIDPAGDVVVEHGSSQSFDITADVGYHVDDVTVDGFSVGAVEYYNFENITSAHTINAEFAINVYTLTYTAGPNGSIVGETIQTVEHGSDGTEVQAVPDEGYHFVQWSDGSVDNPRTDVNVTDNITVEAEFAINEYTLTYTAGANGYIDGISPQVVEHGSDGSPVEAIPDLGYHFVQWSDGIVDNPRIDANVTQNITVEAEFDANQYVLDVIVEGNGIVEIVPEQDFYLHGESVELTAVAEEGWAFSHWVGDVDDPAAETTSIIMDDNKIVTAHFVEYHNIVIVHDVVANPGDQITVDVEVENINSFVAFQMDFALPEGFDYVAASVVLTDRGFDHTITSNVLDGNILRVVSYSMNNTPYAGNEGILFSFELNTPNEGGAWELIAENVVLTNSEYNNIYTGSVPGTIILGTPTFSVDLFANPDDIGAVLTGDGDYEFADVVTITASEVAGYNFIGWTGDEAHIELLDDQFALNASFEMPATDVVFTANYVDESALEVSVDVNPEVAGYVEGAGWYLEGNEVTLTAFANAGYSFINWTMIDEGTGDVVEVGTDAVYTFTMGAVPVHLTANFELSIHTLTLTANPEVGGVVSGEGIVDGQGDFNFGDEIIVDAVPAESYEFVNWTVEGTEVSADASFTFVMPDESVTLTANFEFIPTPTFTLSLVADPEEGGTVSGAGEYEEDEMVTVTAVPATEWKFDGWFFDGNELSTSLEFEFAMPGENITLVAQFSPETSVTELTELNISLYPNPSNGNINITSDVMITDIMIFDMVGKVVHTSQPEASVLDMSLTIEPGMYFVRISTTQGSRTIKLQISK